MSDPRRALDAVGELPDGEIDLAGAALQFARVDAPDADWRGAEAHLSMLAREAAVLPNATLSGRTRALAKLIAARHRYKGEVEGYDDLHNANLIHVTERRRGLPVALGIVWLHCAQAAGWSAKGLDFPGHFLIALDDPEEGQPAVLDVFAGGAQLDPPALRALIKRVDGPSSELRPGVVHRMESRAVLLRLQNNIKSRRQLRGDIAGALACAEDMLRIAPAAAPLWREAALMHQRLDQVAAALRCLERFLTLAPEGEGAGRARLLMEELRTRLN